MSLVSCCRMGLNNRLLCLLYTGELALGLHSRNILARRAFVIFLWRDLPHVVSRYLVDVSAKQNCHINFAYFEADI
jgi:hypothetical protein